MTVCYKSVGAWSSGCSLLSLDDMLNNMYKTENHTKGNVDDVSDDNKVSIQALEAGSWLV